MRLPVGFEALPAALIADIMAGFRKPQAASERAILTPLARRISAELRQALRAHAPKQYLIRRAILGVQLEARPLSPLGHKFLRSVGVSLGAGRRDRIAEHRQPTILAPEAGEGIV